MSLFPQKRYLLLSLFILVVIEWAILPNTAFCDEILFDNGAGSHAELETAALSDYDHFPMPELVFFTADDFFVSSPSKVTGVTWTGVYIDDGLPAPDDDFEIAFYEEIGGTPQLDPFLVFDIDASRRDTGVEIQFGVGLDTIYEYTAEFDPVLFSSDTNYWLSIRNRTFNTSDNWYWTAEQNSGLGNSHRSIDFGPWAPWQTSVAVDFKLTGHTVPEPSVALIYVILIGQLVNQRKRIGDNQR